MKFDHDQHRQVYERVQLYLEELFDENLYHEEKTGHFYVRYGSTVLEVSVDPYGPEDAIMTVMAYCVQDVELTDNLLRGLLELNHALPFGSFSLVGNDIFFSHALLGRTLERSNVLTAVATVATVSDDYDDLIAEKYGGERALDRIRHTGGIKRRRAALKTPVPEE